MGVTVAQLAARSVVPRNSEAEVFEIFIDGSSSIVLWQRIIQRLDLVERRLGLELFVALAGQRQGEVGVGARPQQEPRRHRPLLLAGQLASMFELLLGQLQMEGGLRVVSRADLFGRADR